MGSTRSPKPLSSASQTTYRFAVADDASTTRFVTFGILPVSPPCHHLRVSRSVGLAIESKGNALVSEGKSQSYSVLCHHG